MNLALDLFYRVDYAFPDAVNFYHEAHEELEEKNYKLYPSLPSCSSW